MNYLDIREEQGYFIFYYPFIPLTRKRNYQVSLHMDFNYYFKLVVAYFLFPNFTHVRNNSSRLIISQHIISLNFFIV